MAGHDNASTPMTGSGVSPDARRNAIVVGVGILAAVGIVVGKLLRLF